MSTGKNVDFSFMVPRLSGMRGGNPESFPSSLKSCPPSRRIRRSGTGHKFGDNSPSTCKPKSANTTAKDSQSSWPQAWSRLFQNLRASAESELASKYPLHVVTQWIGNAARIAERHYLQIPDEFFDLASGVKKDTEAARQVVAQNPTQYRAAGEGGAMASIKLIQGKWKTPFFGLLWPSASKCRTYKWRRRESNPHFRDATAACSRYTTPPGLRFMTLFYRNIRTIQQIFRPRGPKKLRTSTSRSLLSYPSARASARVCYRRDNLWSLAL